jgi:glycosyltransferase involved in cell wall biosynthesis
MRANDDIVEAADYHPRLSVIIPLYNHDQFIGEAIHSVLEQSFSDFELIVINDGSTDASEEVVKTIRDERILYLSQANQGASSTINRGIRIAKGEYISILNSDDVYYPARLERCLRFLEENDSVDAVFSHLEFIDSDGKFIKFLRGAEENWSKHDPETSFKDEHNIVMDLLAGNFLLTTSNLFCRKSIFDRLGYFLNLRYAHDYDFFLRLCYHFKVHIIEEPLLKYRSHAMNIIKENEAAVSFEVGLILANFFLHYDIGRYFKGSNNDYLMMTKVLNSLDTYGADRMILTLLLFGKADDGRKRSFFTVLTGEPENPFRESCISRFKAAIEGWRESQQAWTKWSETNKRLVEAEEKLKKINETLGDLETKEQQLQGLLNSYSFRIGRILTWPVRMMRKVIRAR